MDMERFARDVENSLEPLDRAIKGLLRLMERAGCKPCVPHELLGGHCERKKCTHSQQGEDTK